MASPMSRTVVRSLKGRLYSVQAARKTESTSSGSDVVSTKVNGVNLLTVENNSPISRLTFIAKAGSRYEDPSNLGVTHVIRHTSQLTNQKNSFFKTFKGLEEIAANYTASTTRDNAMMSVSCTRNNLAAAFELVAPCFARNMFDPWDWRDFGGGAHKVEYDVAALRELPNVALMEELHRAAYREGLGNSLYCPEAFVGQHSTDQILRFMKAHYRPDRVAVVATGVDAEEIRTLMTQNLKFSDAGGAKANDAKSNYVAGERRANRADLAATYTAVATQGPSLSSKELLPAAVLQQIMGFGSRIKYSECPTASRLCAAVQKVTNSPFMINSVNVNYTDSGLFGFAVVAPPKDMDKILRTAFAEFASITKTGVSDAEVARGKSQLKAYIAMNLESGDAVITNLAEQALNSEKLNSVNDMLKMVDSIQTADVSNVAKKLVNGKPSMASVGQLTNVPYLDQLVK